MRKYILLTVMLCVLWGLTLYGCGGGDVSGAAAVLQKYHDAMIADDHDTMQSLRSSEYKTRLANSDGFASAADALAKGAMSRAEYDFLNVMAAKCTYKIDSIKAKSNSAVARVIIYMPDVEKVLDDVPKNDRLQSMLYMDPARYQEIVLKEGQKALETGNFQLIEEINKVTMIKENGEWRIHNED